MTKLEVYCDNCAANNVSVELGKMVGNLISAGIEPKLIQQVIAGLLDSITDEVCK